MNQIHFAGLRLRTGLVLGTIAAVIYAASVAVVAAAGDTNAPVAKAPNSKPANTTSTGRTLSGAELYSMHCNRCHPERYPTERTAAQWKTIVLHMRVRANLPAGQARTILKYLQDNSGR